MFEIQVSKTLNAVHNYLNIAILADSLHLNYFSIRQEYLRKLHSILYIWDTKTTISVSIHLIMTRL